MDDYKGMRSLVLAVEKMAKQWADDLEHLQECRRIYCERCAHIEVRVKETTDDKR